MSMGYRFCLKERRFMLVLMREGRLACLEFLSLVQDQLGQHSF